MKLLLIRGLPGSGKSTMAAGLEGFKHYEADMYFTHDGEYSYNKDEIQDAHAWCQMRTFAALDDGNDVVVSNTFSRRWEMQPYEEMAQRFGAALLIITVKGEHRNVHGVPDEVIERMRQRWED
jgi:Predicted kinase